MSPSYLLRNWLYSKNREMVCRPRLSGAEDRTAPAKAKATGGWLSVWAQVRQVLQVCRQLGTARRLTKLMKSPLSQLPVCSRADMGPGPTRCQSVWGFVDVLRSCTGFLD